MATPTPAATPVTSSLATATRSGFLTSEFALKVVAGAVTVLLGSGVLPDSSTSGQLALAAMAIVVVAVFALVYGYQRFILKQNTINLTELAINSYNAVEAAEQAKLGPKAVLPALSPEVIAILNGLAAATPTVPVLTTGVVPAPAPAAVSPTTINIGTQPTPQAYMVDPNAVTSSNTTTTTTTTGQ